jgi:hypothetical protein
MDIMKSIKIFILVVAFFSSPLVNTAPRMNGDFGDIAYDISGTFKPETFYAKNLKWLNNDNVNDRIWFMRHIFDLKSHFLYGKESYGIPVAEFQFTLRNRGIWGNIEGVIKTTNSEARLSDIGFHSHSHAIPRYLFWMREAWLDINMGRALGIKTNDSHHFKLGVFPCQLGRGIALGDAYGVGPEYLGFFTETIVDQFACGALLEGDLIAKKLHYDIYTGILQNKCSTYADIIQKVYGQEYGRFNSPQRGFGKVNFVIASRLKWQAIDNALGKLTFEPYALFNHDPEQKIDFTADASSKLGTFGLAGEYYGDRIEFGFDYAFNIGKQNVAGWDRNQVIVSNRNGQSVFVNSHVVDQNNEAIPFVRDSVAQKIIDPTNKTQQDESLNGQVIGYVDSVGYLPSSLAPGSNPVALKNKPTRYRNPYNNRYEGYMFVIDASCWVYKKELQAAVTAGFSSGDDNPNLETKDQKFGGFIPLQEIYVGKRVQSTHFLGSGKIGRPLSVPQPNQASKFAKTVSNFSNLVYWGTGLKWEPSNWTRRLSVRPNALMFWNDFKINKYDAVLKKELNEKASTYLGAEINVSIDYYFFKDIKVFCVSSVFIPGTHFRDIRGRPFDPDQEAALVTANALNPRRTRFPNIGDDLSYILNMGLEFKF